MEEFVCGDVVQCNKFFDTNHKKIGIVTWCGYTTYLVHFDRNAEGGYDGEFYHTKNLRLVESVNTPWKFQSGDEVVTKYSRDETLRVIERLDGKDTKRYICRNKDGVGSYHYEYELVLMGKTRLNKEVVMEAKFKVQDEVEVRINQRTFDSYVKGEVLQVIPMIKYVVDTKYGVGMYDELDLESVDVKSSGTFRVGDYVYSEEHREDMFKVEKTIVSVDAYICRSQITGNKLVFYAKDLLGISDDYAETFISKALKQDSKGG